MVHRAGRARLDRLRRRRRARLCGRDDHRGHDRAPGGLHREGQHGHGPADRDVTLDRRRRSSPASSRAGCPTSRLVHASGDVRGAGHRRHLRHRELRGPGVRRAGRPRGVLRRELPRPCRERRRACLPAQLRRDAARSRAGDRHGGRPRRPARVAGGATASVVRTPASSRGERRLYRGAGTGYTDRRVRNGDRYRYVLTLFDEAGNAASRELSASPARGCSPPSAAPRWPVPRCCSGSRCAARATTTCSSSAGSTRSSARGHGAGGCSSRRRGGSTGAPRLIPGTYRWYVWPGEGRRAERRYGPRIGRRSFVIG